jgi:putative tributyrin esterase
MISMRTALFSEALGMCTSVSVLMPQRTAGQIGMAGTTRDAPPPVLYLLHGASDDDTIWTRRTSIERYASDYGLAVVMPQVNISFYADEAYGYAWWTFVSEELPTIIADTFNVSSAREDTFVAGLSMGGFGAFKLALNRPERFAAAASLSGALDMCGARPDHGMDQMVKRVWGEQGIVPDGPDDLVSLVKRADPAALPKLYLSCGTEDFLFQDNLTFEAAAQGAGVDLTIDHRPGTHEWGYWDTTIQDVLAWLPLGQSS